jgi:hypothetical protein
MSIKIERNWKGSDVRRVRVADLPRESKSDFQTVVSYVKVSFPSTPNFVLKYKDDEGDLVTISSETEFQEALRVASIAKRCLKMYLFDAPQPKPNREIVSTPVPSDALISDPLTVELQYLGRSRTVSVSKSTIAISQLQETAAVVFPELKSKDYSLKYLDDEGDAVTMTEADELQDALQLVKEGQPFVLLVSLNVGSVSTSLVSGGPELNEGSKSEKVQKEEERKKKKWEDVTWDDLNETLEKLQKLGFTDTGLCSRLLEQHNYEFEAVLRELRARSDKTS